MKIRRILVAVDASPHSLAALEAAAALAARRRAELAGIFIEDSDLMRLSGLPFAREMIFPLAFGRPLDEPLMKSRLKELAEMARQAISEAALRANVNWTFHVRRGAIVAELTAAAGESDLLVLGKASHLERSRRVRLGTTAAHILARASLPVLVLQHGEQLRGPALIVSDGSPESLEKLSSALDAASLFGGAVAILLIAKSREEAAAMKEEIEKKTERENLHFRRWPPTEKAGLIRLAHEEEAGIVIFAGLPFSIAPEELPEMLDKLDRPVMVF